jgi:hypothetical protein
MVDAIAGGGGARWIRVCAALLSLAICCGAAWADAPSAGKLLFLGVAYDEGPPQGFGPGHFDYAPDNISRLFHAQSEGLYSTIDVVTLKSNAATHQRVIAALRGLQKAARPNDLAFIYWGTHGGTSNKGWGANLPGGGAIYAGEIKQELSRIGCPVICMISTCGSGGFPHDGNDGVTLPENVVALCACRGKQSTNNELDRAVCEALAGFADSDASGDVTLGEVVRYIPLRYRKIFRGGEPGTDQLPVLAHAENAPLDRVLAAVQSDDYVAVSKDGVWYGATVLERGGKGTKVRYLGFDSTTRNAGFSMPDEWVEDELIDVPGGEQPIEVEWDGTWYPARILGREGVQLKIHYLGYPETDDETVPRSRVRFAFTDAPDVKKRPRQNRAK